MPIDPEKLATMREELEARGRALDDRMAKFGLKWQPIAIFLRDEFRSDLGDLCEAWGKHGSDVTLCEMAGELSSAADDLGLQKVGESGSRSSRDTKRARSIPKKNV